MVLKKRLDFGFNGYEIPVIPRGPRSVRLGSLTCQRRRHPHKKSVEDQQICAFELLAAVAGKLLQESESSASSNASETKVQPDLNINGIKQERVAEIKAFRSECLDQGSCVESAFIPDFIGGDHNLKSTLKAHPHAESDSLLEHTSIITSSDFSKKVNCDLKLGICNDRNVDENISYRKEGVSHKLQDLCKGKLESEMERQVGNETTQIGDLTVANCSSVKNQIEKCMNKKPLINSDSSVQLSLHRDPVPVLVFPRIGTMCILELEMMMTILFGAINLASRLGLLGHRHAIISEELRRCGLQST